MLCNKWSMARVDADNVGDKLELYLLREKWERHKTARESCKARAVAPRRSSG